MLKDLETTAPSAPSDKAAPSTSGEAPQDEALPTDGEPSEGIDAPEVAPSTDESDKPAEPDALDKPAEPDERTP